MKQADAMAAGFRQAVRDGRALIGAFIKIASHQAVELVARTGVDFAIVDSEHAPFDLVTLDRMALAGRGEGLPLLLRPPGIEPTFIGQVLDLGLGGIVAPHIDSAEAAGRLLDASRYDRGRRGFSPSTRPAGYGAADAAALRVRSDADTSIWCQIEDAAALPRLDEIASVADVDCLFLGRADLALSLGVDSTADPKVAEAVRATADAGRRHGRAVGIHVASTNEIPDLMALGVTVFTCGSDQGWMIAEGRKVRAGFDAAVAGAA